MIKDPETGEVFTEEELNELLEADNELPEFADCFKDN
jgi:hypothetical protein